MDKKNNKQTCLAAYHYLLLGQSLEDVAEHMGLSVAEVRQLLKTFKARVLANTKTRSPRRSGAEAYWQALQKQPQDEE
jgi:transposase